VVTGTGTPISFTAGVDGTYTFSITNDGSGCDLLNFTNITVSACNCQANAGTFTTLTNRFVCFQDTFALVSDNNFSGSFKMPLITM
jgi:hypothetical protein